jgi:hypothetical protein
MFVQCGIIGGVDVLAFGSLERWSGAWLQQLCTSRIHTCVDSQVCDTVYAVVIELYHV